MLFEHSRVSLPHISDVKSAAWRRIEVSLQTGVAPLDLSNGVNRKAKFEEQQSGFRRDLRKHVDARFGIGAACLPTRCQRLASFYTGLEPRKPAGSECFTAMTDGGARAATGRRVSYSMSEGEYLYTLIVAARPPGGGAPPGRRPGVDAVDSLGRCLY